MRPTRHAASRQSIYDRVDARLRLFDSRVETLGRDMAELRDGTDGLKQSLEELARSVDSVPRALAEMLAERDKRS